MANLQSGTPHQKTPNPVVYSSELLKVDIRPMTSAFDFSGLQSYIVPFAISLFVPYLLLVGYQFVKRVGGKL